ncbi:serine/threonine protein phosphatase [Colwellia sp. MT41]|uniref:Serine/threonine phosphatase n=1 Tax=Colwellia marinimaniae TaxID=1513592 RepID=A0ABQ0MSP3_9GAMM|nr:MULTISPECIES: protein phosphatase 2C domain-containing protein [Colwellia]ALO35482.1 serine/threonine protein phosphatase [Colwellia sp. MT41]GAW95390.1 serine/threonine phosphatase [Colwellia marinimaniae]
MNYHIKSLCHQGAIRDNNEDAISYGINEELGIIWMLVADGMGGHNAGEVASAMLVDHIKKAWDKISVSPYPHWDSWITKQLNGANMAILQQAKNQQTQQGMGTTGVLMVIDQYNCHIGWVGDSRAYSFKSEQLQQETVDHTMVQELVNKGVISAATAKKSNTKNMLSQAIGVREKITIDTVTIVISNGDTIMLSTDGLHDYLTEQEISHYLSQFSVNKNVCHDMIKQAIAKNSRDNLTVGLINLPHKPA